VRRSRRARGFRWKRHRQLATRHRAQAGSRTAQPPSEGEGILDAAEHGGILHVDGVSQPRPMNRERPRSAQVGSLPVHPSRFAFHERGPISR